MILILLVLSAAHKELPWLFPVLNVVRVRTICKAESYVFAKKLIFIIKTIKRVTPLSLYDKNWSVLKLIDNYYVSMNWLLRTTKIVCENEN